jgi:general secretion pathway protein C
MKNLSNSYAMTFVINVLFFALIAKLIGVIALWFLPAKTVELQEDNSKIKRYSRVDFHNLIDASAKGATTDRAVTQSENIRNLLLVGLYGNSGYGYAIVAKKPAQSGTKIVAVGEDYEGYKLSNIAINYVVFVKNNKEYILRFVDKTPKSSIQKSMRTVSDARQISRNEIDNYAKNPSQLWRDISINEIKKEGKIIGFKVLKIKQGSQLSKLGLQSGDIIIKANDVDLTSYGAVIKIYQNINNLDSIVLTIKRGNTEKELTYEIN